MKQEAIAGGSEYDGAENFQLNLNGEKWLDDNIKIKSTIYSRKQLLIMMEVLPMKQDMFQIIECTQSKLVWNTFQKQMKII